MPGPSEPHPVALPADRLEFETLISDMSALLMAAPPEQVEPAIDEALDQVRAFFRADRVVSKSGAWKTCPPCG